MQTKNRHRGLRSGEVARETGVSADTLRHYERRGLLPAPERLASGYRVYSAEAVERVHLVQRGLAIGFSLEELTTFLGERDAGKAPCRKVRAAVGVKLDEVERQISGLQRFRDDLRKMLAEWDRRLAARTNDEPLHLHLLDSVETSDRMAGVVVSEVRFSRRPGRRRRTT